MTVSQRAIESGAMPQSERPVSEVFRLTAKSWVDKDAAARLLEELKTTRLEQMKAKLIRDQGDMADNKVERLVKSGTEWEELIIQMVDARTAANLAKAKMEYVRMQFAERQSAEASNRHEARLSRN